MHKETRAAIVRMVSYISDDERIARYLALPSEGVTAAHVAHIRASLPKRFTPPPVKAISQRQRAFEIGQERRLRESTRQLARAIRVAAQYHGS